MDKKSSEYKLIRMADTSFLFCIIFEVVGIMTVMFIGTLGAQMAIYFMTMLFAVFMARKRRAEFTIPFEKPKVGTLLQSIGISVCGIPIALMLSALASLLSSAGADSSEDIAKYPVWLAIIAFAIVPAVVEEYVFRGLIFGAYMKVDARAAVVISSLFFALLHFSLGSILYGFFYGCVFALIRIATGNMMYSMVMHLVFNAVNVAVAYMGAFLIPGWVVALLFVAGLAGFITLCILFFRKHPVEITGSGYKRHELVTKEGYMTMAVCMTVTSMLLMM